MNVRRGGGEEKIPTCSTQMLTKKAEKCLHRHYIILCPNAS